MTRAYRIHPEIPRALPDGLSLPIYFANRQWAVTGYGIERLDSYYPIEARRLDERRAGTDLPDWILHLGEKATVDVEAFHQAFVFALKRHRRRYRKPFTDEQIARALDAALRRKRESAEFEVAFDEWMRARDPRYGRNGFKTCTAADLLEFGEMWRGTLNER